MVCFKRDTHVVIRSPEPRAARKMSILLEMGLRYCYGTAYAPGGVPSTCGSSFLVGNDFAFLSYLKVGSLLPPFGLVVLTGAKAIIEDE